MSVVGIHLLVDLKECNRELLDDLPYIKDAMTEAAKEVGAGIIGESFHRFQPQGVTGILAITESHICIHTWPELGYAAVDIFTCGASSEPRRGAQVLVERLQSKEPHFTELRRGAVSQPVTAP